MPTTPLMRTPVRRTLFNTELIKQKIVILNSIMPMPITHSPSGLIELKNHATMQKFMNPAMNHCTLQ